MKSLIVNLYEKLARFGEPACKSRVRQELLMHSDRMLADMGFDRDKLLRGTEAWPWRAEAPSEADNVTRMVFENPKPSVTEDDTTRHLAA